MIIPDIIKNNYSVSIKKVKTAKNNKEKRLFLEELIGNLQNAAIDFSIRLLSKILKISRQLIRSVLYGEEKNNISETRGRNKFEDNNPKIIEQIKEICESTENVDHSLRDDITYIDVSAEYVIKELKSKYNYTDATCPSANTVRRIFKERLGYKLSKVKKSKVLRKIAETDQIFDNVNQKKAEIKESNNTTIAFSIDDKATKKIGNISSGGSSWIEREALDHDTNFECSVKPFGMLNMKTNQSTIFCTSGNSTAEFKVDCIEQQLITELSINPYISKMYLVLDNGPDNSSRRKLWIYKLIKISILYNIEIELVYYPPYHSKYNLIEHLWGVLQRHWNGLIIDSIPKLLGAINTMKWNGIYSKAVFIEKKFNIGQKVNEAELKQLVEEHVIYKTPSIQKWSLVIRP